MDDNVVSLRVVEKVPVQTSKANIVENLEKCLERILLFCKNWSNSFIVLSPFYKYIIILFFPCQEAISCKSKYACSFVVISEIVSSVKLHAIKKDLNATK